MLRHINYGYRNFQLLPDVASVRYNWVFLVSFDNKLRPKVILQDGTSPRIKKSSNFFIIPPNTKYVLLADEPDCYRVAFHFSHVPELLSRFIMKRGVFGDKLNLSQLDEVRAILTRVRPYHEEPTELSPLVFDWALSQLSLLALQDYKFEKVAVLENIGRQRVSDAVAWFCEHIGESPSLSDIASVVHVSPTQLRRHFYEEFGKSPKPVFNKLRMQRAAQLLSTTSETLDQIAEQCGYQAATDFCRAFKREFQISPNRWRHNVNDARWTDKSSFGINMFVD